jgi:uncharacterized membrane-anchored protein YhcB (DUF1043 family)
MENCVPEMLACVDTVNVIDTITIKRIIVDSVTLEALKNSQAFYNSAFCNVLTVISIFIAIFIGYLVFYNRSSNKNLKDELKNEFESLKSEVENLKNEVEKEFEKQKNEIENQKSEVENQKKKVVDIEGTTNKLKTKVERVESHQDEYL